MTWVTKSRTHKSDNTGGAPRTVLPVRDSLVRAVLSAEAYAPKPRVQPKPASAFSGPKPRPNGRKISLPDEVFLEIRRLSEQCLMRPAAIAEELKKHGYTLELRRVSAITSYTTGSSLIPSEKAAPYLPIRNN